MVDFEVCFHCLAGIPNLSSTSKYLDWSLDISLPLTIFLVKNIDVLYAMKIVDCRNTSKNHCHSHSKILWNWMDELNFIEGLKWSHSSVHTYMHKTFAVYVQRISWKIVKKNNNNLPWNKKKNLQVWSAMNYTSLYTGTNIIICSSPQLKREFILNPDLFSSAFTINVIRACIT